MLFLDEPTTGLDPVSRKAIWEEVAALNTEGTTVFLTTQYLEEADQLADRVGIIGGGRIVAEGTPASLKAEVGKPHLELGLADGDGRRGPRRSAARFGRLLPEKDGQLLVELEGGAADVAQVVRALDEAGILVESLDLVEPTLDDVFVAKTGEHLGGRRGRRTAARRGRSVECVGWSPTRAWSCALGRALGQADLPPPAARRADPRSSRPCCSRSRPAARAAPSTCPASRRSTTSSSFMLAGAMIQSTPAGRQHRRHRARRRPRDGVHRPPAGGADLALRDRPRPARRDRRARRVRRRSGSSPSG